MENEGGKSAVKAEKSGAFQRIILGIEKLRRSDPLPQISPN
jgi:hypothetical protein